MFTNINQGCGYCSRAVGYVGNVHTPLSLPLPSLPLPHPPSIALPICIGVVYIVYVHVCMHVNMPACTCMCRYTCTHVFMWRPAIDLEDLLDHSPPLIQKKISYLNPELINLTHLGNWFTPRSCLCLSSLGIVVRPSHPPGIHAGPGHQDIDTVP